MNTRQAQEGYWLTQSSLDFERDRIFVKTVCGYGDLNTVYTEWSDADKTAWESQYIDNEDFDGGGTSS